MSNEKRMRTCEMHKTLSDSQNAKVNINEYDDLLNVLVIICWHKI
jgi:hypothetical protein